MNTLFERANKKLVDHIDKINFLFSAYGEDLVFSDEFNDLTTVTNSNTLDDVLLFFFALGYEIRDYNEGSVFDDKDRLAKIFQVLIDLDENHDFDADQSNVFNFAKFFLHLYFVLENPKQWTDFAIENNVLGKDLRNLIQFSFENLRLGLKHLSNIHDDDNIIFHSLKEGEYLVVYMLCKEFFKDGRKPDISSMYLLADQLDNEDFFKVWANNVFGEIAKDIERIRAEYLAEKERKRKEDIELREFVMNQARAATRE